MIKNYYKLIVVLLFATNVFGQNLPSYLPKDGLVGWWPFNGNANDESGNGNHGTVNGATLTLDRNGYENKAYNFDGISSFIEVKHSKSLIFEKNFSICTWVKINDYSKNENQYWKRRAIVGKPRSQQGTGIELFSINGESSNFGGGIRNSYPDGAGVISLDSLPLNKWELLILTYNGEKIKLYKNGNLIGETLTNLGLDPSTSSLFFGKEFYGEVSESRSFKGQIDDVAIFNRALTEKEIQVFYTSTLISENLPSYLPKNGLIGWWPFNGNANDESGNGNHGTVNEATLTADRSRKLNSAYQFDGVKSFIEVPFKNMFNTYPLSITTWIKTKNEQRGGIISRYENCSLNGYAITSNYGKLSTYYFSENKAEINTDCCLKEKINIDMWKMITVVFNKDSVFIYSDNKLIDQHSFSVNTPNATSSKTNLIFGKMLKGMCDLGYDLFFDGLIDDIAIYNRALTGQEVKQLYEGCQKETAISSSFNYPAFVTGKPVSLSAEPQGGVFKGVSVENNQFVPAKAKIGTNKIQYNFKNSNGCNDSTLFSMIVADTVGNTCVKYDTITYTDTVSVLKINFKLTTGIKANQLTSISVYPNPTSDVLKIEVTDVKALEGYRYRILDVVGKEVYNENVKNQITEIPMKSLGAAGIYLFEVLDANKLSVQSNQIVLQ